MDLGVCQIILCELRCQRLKESFTQTGPFLQSEWCVEVWKTSESKQSPSCQTLIKGSCEALMIELSSTHAYVKNHYKKDFVSTPALHKETTALHTEHLSKDICPVTSCSSWTDATRVINPCIQKLLLKTSLCHLLPCLKTLELHLPPWVHLCPHHGSPRHTYSRCANP